MDNSIPETALERRARKLAYMAGWRQRNPDAKKNWDKANATRVRAEQKEYRETHRELIASRMKEWRRNNKAHRKSYKKQWGSKNRHLVRLSQNRSINRRRAKDPAFRLHRNMRVLIQMTLGNTSKKFFGRTMEIIGCEREFFGKWIQSQFLPGMNWENRGEWSIDHILPISCCGDIPSRVILANNYRNLRPMWNTDNHRKSDKLEEASIVSAIMCGIDEILVRRKYQAPESLLVKAEKCGIKVIRGWL